MKTIQLNNGEIDCISEALDILRGICEDAKSDEPTDQQTDERLQQIESIEKMLQDDTPVY